MKVFGWLIPWWAYAIAAALAIGGAFSAGWQVRAWKCEAAQTKALKAQQIAFQKQLAQQQDESEQYEQERGAAREDSRERETEVRTIYKDRIVPGECAVPDDARRVLEQAVTDANRAAGQPG